MLVSRCRNHLWDWVRDDYTTARYEYRRCGKERGVWKNRTQDFEQNSLIGQGRPDNQQKEASHGT